MIRTELCKIFEKYQSDKCPAINHSYSIEYYDLLKNIRYDVKNVLEVGVGNFSLMSNIVGQKYIPGASLRAWEEFFPNANIIGLDIDKNILFKENRISCYYTDQSNKEEIEKTIDNIKIKSFDLIIDDGSHIVDHMILTYNILHKYLSKNGLYIIEDIKIQDLDIFINHNINNNMKICKIHHGKNNWDSFIAYRRK